MHSRLCADLQIATPLELFHKLKQTRDIVLILSHGNVLWLASFFTIMYACDPLHVWQAQVDHGTPLMCKDNKLLYVQSQVEDEH